MFCDADLIVCKDIISILYSTIRRYNRVYAIVPIMFYGNPNNWADIIEPTIWWCGKYDSHLGKNSSMELNVELSIGSFVGTCSLIDIDIFKKNNLWFDPELFIYHEDVDALGFLKNRIYCLFQPYAIAFHNISKQVSGKYFDIFRNYITLRNKLIVGIKHLRFDMLLFTFITYIKMNELSVRLKIRSFLFGMKIGLFKFFGFYSGKIIDPREYKRVHNMSKLRLILR